jgi:hypothetical protein
MGTLYTFHMFDGSQESINDGGLGTNWVRQWAQNNLYIQDVWEISAVNYTRKGYEFFNS